MNAILDLLAASALACCFIPLGDFIRGRLSRTLCSANESFLIGSTLMAAVLFPASLLLGSMAFPVSFCLACCLGAVWGGPVPEKFVAHMAGLFGKPRSLLSRAAIFSIGMCFAYFCWQNLTWGLESDGLQIWAWRASLLFRRGELTGNLWPESRDNVRIFEYPPLIPLVEAFMGGLRGDALLSHCKAVFCLFYGSLGLSLCAASRSIAGAQPAIVFTASILVLPGIISGTNQFGFADLPMAALVAAICASALETRTAPIGFRHPLPWLVAGLLTVKSEGAVLFWLTAIVLAVAWFHARNTASNEVRTGAWQTASILLFGQVLRTAYVKWIAVGDIVYGPLDEVHLARAVFLWADIPAESVRYLVDLTSWGLLWIALPPSLTLVAWKGRIIPRLLAFGVASALLSYTGIFYFTNWDFQVHMLKAYPRLLEHIAPGAALVVLSAWTLIGDSARSERQQKSASALVSEN